MVLRGMLGDLHHINVRYPVQLLVNCLHKSSYFREDFLQVTDFAYPFGAACLQLAQGKRYGIGVDEHMSEGDAVGEVSEGEAASICIFSEFECEWKHGSTNISALHPSYYYNNAIITKQVNLASESLINEEKTEMWNIVV